ncbi:MAG TPA: [protein-PII] uridylyltransferase [Marmoricola sp.]|nr:[protein-PII] uridylyltransferase [Marmoricola sp.]
MTAPDRVERTTHADQLSQRAYGVAGCPATGAALVAVGGYGRGHLAPHSDLDLVLVHDDDVPLGGWASQLWYPLWDSGFRIDHAVRSLSQMLQSVADPKVALGLLDIRHVAGDPNLTLRLRTAALADWRKQARARLPELHQLVVDRERRYGELAHASIPDLKEAIGGLRDAMMLKALVASWLIDVPHRELESCRDALLDVRDALHTVAGRATDRVAPEYWDDLADELALPDSLTTQRHVRSLGRRMTHLTRLSWRRAEAVLRRTPSSGVRRPQLTQIGPGLAVAYEEVVLDATRGKVGDPFLILRAAAEAAERALVLDPRSAARMIGEPGGLPTPWPGHARESLVRLLAAGDGLRGVWETLEETGGIAKLLPEWERVALLPHESVVHKFTVDRHLVETCVEASSLIRKVARPDLLVVAALLHDLGKGQGGDHSITGEPIAIEIARRVGFPDADVNVIATLVRWHLLLVQTATTRDLDDPATIATVTDSIATREELDLLTALTEADAKATGGKAWTNWRASLISELARKAEQQLDEGELPVRPPEPVVIARSVLIDPTKVQVELQSGDDGAMIRVISGERLGLLADIAAMLGLAKISIRTARAWPQTVEGMPIAVSEWHTDPHDFDAAELRQRLEAVVQRRVQTRDRLRRTDPGGLEPSVNLHPQASAHATVLEVRATDRPGLVYQVCFALAGLGVSITSAHLDTVGPQVVDFFYLQNNDRAPLSTDHAQQAVEAVLVALS